MTDLSDLTGDDLEAARAAARELLGINVVTEWGVRYNGAEIITTSPPRMFDKEPDWTEETARAEKIRFDAARKTNPLASKVTLYSRERMLLNEATDWAKVRA